MSGITTTRKRFFRPIFVAAVVASTIGVTSAATAQADSWQTYGYDIKNVSNENLTLVYLQGSKNGFETPPPKEVKARATAHFEAYAGPHQDSYTMMYSTSSGGTLVINPSTTRDWTGGVVDESTCTQPETVEGNVCRIRPAKELGQSTTFGYLPTDKYEISNPSPFDFGSPLIGQPSGNGFTDAPPAIPAYSTVSFSIPRWDAGVGDDTTVTYHSTWGSAGFNFGANQAWSADGTLLKDDSWANDNRSNALTVDKARESDPVTRLVLNY